jgi:hypothetical protein
VKAGYKNVTISLPEPLLRKFRVYAAGRNQSMTSLMAEFINRAITQEDEHAEARHRILQRLDNPPNLGTNGRIAWRREELYDDRIHRH